MTNSGILGSVRPASEGPILLRLALIRSLTTPETDSAICSTSSTVKFGKPENLKGLSVCHPLGNNLKFIQPLIEKNIIELSQPVGFEDCFRMLKKRRTDLVQVADSVGIYILNSMYGGMNGIKILSPPLQQSSLHLIVSKKHPHGKRWITKFDNAFTRLSSSGKIQKIIDFHLSSPK